MDKRIRGNITPALAGALSLLLITCLWGNTAPAQQANTYDITDFATYDTARTSADLLDDVFNFDYFNAVEIIDTQSSPNAFSGSGPLSDGGGMGNDVFNFNTAIMNMSSRGRFNFEGGMGNDSFNINEGFGSRLVLDCAAACRCVPQTRGCNWAPVASSPRAMTP